MLFGLCVMEEFEPVDAQGRFVGYCFGKTPMQTFLDAIPLAKEKLLNQTGQTNPPLANVG